MPNPYDKDDPFGLLKSVRNNLFGGAGFGTSNRPGEDVGFVGGDDAPFFGPPMPSNPLEEWGGGGDTIAKAAEAVMPKYITSSKIVGASKGAPDLSGASDLIGNYAFQRLWESYNAGKRTDEPMFGVNPGEAGFDWIKALLGPTDNPAFTRHQGEGGGYLWGYVDPTWLPGYNPGRRVTTITELIAPLLGGGGGGPATPEEPDVTTGRRGRPDPIPFVPPAVPWLPPEWVPPEETPYV